jgi:hypothetical protein
MELLSCIIDRLCSITYIAIIPWELFLHIIYKDRSVEIYRLFFSSSLVYCFATSAKKILTSFFPFFRLLLLPHSIFLCLAKLSCVTNHLTHPSIRYSYALYHISFLFSLNQTYLLFVVVEIAL